MSGCGTAPPIDLSICDQEPIHIPGAIQPHGALVALLADGLVITHASANLAAITGLTVAAVLGRRVVDVFGEAVGIALSELVSACGGAAGDVLDTYTVASVGSRRLHLHGFRSGTHICLDVEPVPADAQAGSCDTVLRSALEALARATRPAELCAVAVNWLKTMMGYDRVMAYRFAEDEHGEIIAEVCEPWMERYLGLHYPAADIPKQARQLYLRQRVCVIPDVGFTPCGLTGLDPADTAAALDLSRSMLRSVSPLHRQYLRNMGVAASVSVALVRPSNGREARLWGMFVCHASEPRAVGPDMRPALEVIGQFVSALLGTLEDAELYASLIDRTAALRALVERITAPVPFPLGLAASESELLRLVGAAGALVQISGTVLTVGRTPPPEAAARALARLRAGGDVVAVDNLGQRYPDLAECTADGSGALLMPLPDGSAILWFRPEQARTVTWGGDPDHHAVLDPVSGRLSPRGSFAAWKRTETGRSVAWGAADLSIARELRRLVEAAVAERASIALARLSRYDPLTGLPNRSLLEERMACHATCHAAGERPIHDQGSARQAALVFLDLDGFKAVNDTMGHQAGDTLLVEIARRLLAAACADSLVARLGGDEFVVLCVGLDQAAMSAVCETILHAVAAPIDIAGRPCHVTCSIGIAVAGQCGSLDLIRAADMAMYVAKQSGGNRVVLFAPAMYDQASLRFELEEDMRSALAGGREFVLLYQPIFAIAGRRRRLAGFEALVRWRHPTHGWLSPASFIPLAEKTGLILPLGDWVLAAAMRQGRMLRLAHPGADLSMNVNVSVLQIVHAGYSSGVADALAAEDYPASALCLEVVESLLANSAAGNVLAEIRKLGVRVAIDDFGIGFSSLSYLRRLPVDKVKLDRSFLEDIEGDPGGLDFLKAVIGLANAAGKPVVFEGVESEAQFHIARCAGVDFVQGYYFAPPLSANAAMELVLKQQQLDASRPEEMSELD